MNVKQKVELPVVAWMTPGGDVSRSFAWCDERCFEGPRPEALTTVAHAEQYARAMVEELIEADAEFDKLRAGYNPLYAKRDELVRYLAAEHRRAAVLAKLGDGK